MMKKSFENFLIWTSLRYCIGRKSYVISYADDFAQVYNDFNDKERKTFSVDIRRQIGEQLRFLPFSLKIEGVSDYDSYDPFRELFSFFLEEGIESFDELAKYKEIIYDARNGVYKTRRYDDNKTQRIYTNEIDDLLCWDMLANFFDKDKHRMLTLKNGMKIVAFPHWVNEKEQVGPKLFKRKEFGWHTEWKPLKSFKKGNKGLIIPLSSIEDIEELWTKSRSNATIKQ